MAAKRKLLWCFQAGMSALVVAMLNGCSGGPSYEALFDPSPEAEGTGIMGAGLVRAVVIIAKYQATERQRQIADQRARLAYARLAQRAAGPESRETSTSGRSTGQKKAATKKLPRYIAVDTEPDARSKGKKSIMLWDTQVQEVVGNNVYDVETPPPPLKSARFETYSAEYVGSGRL
jgi:hypothetical protein